MWAPTPAFILRFICQDAVIQAARAVSLSLNTYLYNRVSGLHVLQTLPTLQGANTIFEG